MAKRDLVQMCTVKPGDKVDLTAWPTDWIDAGWLDDTDAKELKELAEFRLEENQAELAKAQELLYADDRYALLVIFQAMDAAGKDGTIKHVMSGVNPQGCEVTSFKVPSDEELDHNFLWRYTKALPQRGRIGLFNRSYYEEVLVVRVHEDILDSQKLPEDRAKGKHLWHERYDDINALERHLDRNGVKVVKFFLHVSKAEQRERFLARLEDPAKNWKFSARDVAERQHWDEYQQAYADALTATSTDWAPWHVIPADRKWAMRTLVSQVLVDTV
ncbi:MAG TPA: polyphosphate kinase 2 family protein, partial [Acidimicrobiales bacterium]